MDIISKQDLFRKKRKVPIFTTAGNISILPQPFLRKTRHTFGSHCVYAMLCNTVPVRICSILVIKQVFTFCKTREVWAFSWCKILLVTQVLPKYVISSVARAGVLGWSLSRFFHKVPAPDFRHIRVHMYKPGKSVYCMIKVKKKANFEYLAIF